jgi:hypothetical protein
MEQGTRAEQMTGVVKREGMGKRSRSELKRTQGRSREEAKEPQREEIEGRRGGRGGRKRRDLLS